MHWKIRRDPFLAPLARRHGEGAAFEAGFFLDEDVDDAPLDDVDWLCTPLPTRAIGGERPAVLLATGGFCPVHDGHVAMMEGARRAARVAGYDVVAGYLSPGHDDYLRMKCGPAAMPASERIQRCVAAVAPGGWLLVDPWEALHRRVSVNFTDVTARLQAYLRAHVDARMEVLYVAGGDNARFALAFSERGRCIVVSRPGAEAVVDHWKERMAGHPHVLWADGDSPLASRMLRGEVWSEPSVRRLLVRLEDDRAVATLGLPGFAAFQNELLRLLARHAKVRAVRMEERDDGRRAINLDSMLPSRHSIAISRLFALGGYQPLGHVARPGAPPFVQQLAAIPAGTYRLHDDDQMTGGTLDAVRAMLPPSIQIEGTQLAAEHDDDEDVADSRDFLLGADHGGLVVSLPGGRVGRAPYVLPYIDPSVRCGIAPRAVHELSRDVWELNARTFAATALRVCDLPSAARATLAWMGPDTRLEDVGSWHAARIISAR